MLSFIVFWTMRNKIHDVLGLACHRSKYRHHSKTLRHSIFGPTEGAFEDSDAVISLLSGEISRMLPSGQLINEC